MAEQIYLFTALDAISCNNCKNVEAGDQVDLAMRQDLLPALPASVRGIVQLVDDLTYTIQYDDVDLLGVIAIITDEFVSDVTCVQPLTLSTEYTDDQVKPILEALLALGVIPSDGAAALQVVHPDSTEGVSIESIRHDKATVASSDDEVILLDPAVLATPLAISDLTGLSYRIEVTVSAISKKAINERDSQAVFHLIGDFNAGATSTTVSSDERDGVTITATIVGNNFHISTNNQSTADLTVYVSSKFRILN